uniref:Uncharacterized protein n=1 Tax=Anguilla anguilla TaxID=7936 RepID=A0A0E9TZ26_ANGAN
MGKRSHGQECSQPAGFKILNAVFILFLIRKCTSSLVERRPRYTSADETCLLLYVWTTAFVKIRGHRGWGWALEMPWSYERAFVRF